MNFTLGPLSLSECLGYVLKKVPEETFSAATENVALVTKHE